MMATDFWQKMTYSCNIMHLIIALFPNCIDFLRITNQREHLDYAQNQMGEVNCLELQPSSFGPTLNAFEVLGLLNLHFQG